MKNYQTNEHGILVECLRCSTVNTQSGEDDIYCITCASPLLNRCTHEGDINNNGCEAVMPPDAAYCSKCGCRTTFLDAGLVQTDYPVAFLVNDDTLF